MSTTKAEALDLSELLLLLRNESTVTNMKILLNPPLPIPRDYLSDLRDYQHKKAMKEFEPLTKAFTDLLFETRKKYPLPPSLLVQVSLFAVQHQLHVVLSRSYPEPLTSRDYMHFFSDGRVE